MVTSQKSNVLKHVRRLMVLRGGGASDGQLLEAFLARRDEAAFEALVDRYGSLVLGVCRRVLHNHHDAEDAFQATFLVLARQASAIRRRERIGPWLHGVAYRTAMQARRHAARRRVKENQVNPSRTEERSPDDLWQELQPMLDQELQHLPDHYREAIVLCDLLGQTKQEAARQLGCPAGTVSSRLARGRELLRQRLSRRGLSLGASSLPLLLARQASSAGVPPPFVTSTVQAVLKVTAGQAAAGAVSGRVAALSEGVMKTMLLEKLKVLPVLMLVLGLLVVGASFLPLPGWADQPVPGETYVLQNQTLPSSRGAQGPAWKNVATLEGHKDAITCMGYGPGDLLLTADQAGQLKLWDTAAAKELASFKNFEPLNWIHYSPAADWVAFGGKTGFAMTFGKGMKDGKPLHMGPGLGFGDVFKPLTIAPNGKSWVMATKKGVQLMHIDLMSDPIFPTGSLPMAGHEGDILSAAISVDGKTVATGGTDQTVRLWDLAAKKQKALCKGHTDAVVNVALSLDGKWLASASKDGTVRLWDAATGQLKATLTGHKGTVHSVAFDPDSKTLVSGGADQTVRLWAVATSQEIAVLKGHTDAVHAVSFSRDGKTLASAGQDKNVKVWQVK